MINRMIVTRALAMLLACAAMSVAFAAACLAAPAAVGAADSPRTLVEQLNGAVINVLSNKSLATDERRRRVEDLVYSDVDFETVSRLVLARNWSRFTPAQREEFIREFKKHLSLTYRRAIENYRNERIAVESDREEKDGDWTVKTKVLRGGPDDIAIDYRLRKTGDSWRIIDVIVEQMSLVANYRSQFQDVLNGSGPERVVELLRDKNDHSEPLKAPGA